MKEPITRRQFLAGAGLTLAVASTPAGIRCFAMGEADTPSEIFRPSAWFTITPTIKSPSSFANRKWDRAFTRHCPSLWPKIWKLTGARYTDPSGPGD